MMKQTERTMKDTVASDEAKLPPEAQDRIHKAVQRWRAELLCLWKLCPRAACRRAHACSADPDFCVERFTLLVNEDVRDAVDTLHEAKLLGRSYDEARAMARPGSMEAYDRWLANLHQPSSEQPRSQACEAD